MGVFVWGIAALHAVFLTQLWIFPYTLRNDLRHTLHLDLLYAQLTTYEFFTGALFREALIGVLLALCAWRTLKCSERHQRISIRAALFSLATFGLCHFLATLLSQIARTQIIYAVGSATGTVEAQPLYLLAEVIPFLLFAITVTCFGYSLTDKRFVSPVRGIVALWKKAGTWLILSLMAGVFYCVLRFATALSNSVMRLPGMQIEGVVVILFLITVAFAYLYVFFITNILRTMVADGQDA